MRTVLAFLLVLIAGTASAAPSPTETVRSQVDQVLQKAAPTGPKAGDVEQRRAEFRRVANALFDFTEMSRRALGQHWGEPAPVERDEFVRLFKELMARAYMGKLDKYSGEPMSWTGERVEGDQAVVASEVVTPKGTRVPVEYRLHRVSDRWAVYDISVEGVSLVSTYRSQFDKIIRTESFASLLKRLRDKERNLVSSR
ncbi:MAG TPA: ABC transporter substrate-binding protein [Methylomirabilota bacterium]|nr:ABC transporter substrate-binding protein [Methylomirabilota bacterium]